MWLLSLFLLLQAALYEFSITFPNVSETNELLRFRNFHQSSHLVDKVANLGIHVATDLLTPHSNVIISPLNIFAILDVLELGAAGITKEEIGKIVGHMESNEEFRQTLSALDGTATASAVFFSREITPKAEFIQDSYARHQTEILNLDFANGPQATSTINSWASQKTNGTITEILNQDIDASAKVVVVNALTFNGKWLHPFSTLVTETGRFDVDEENFINVPLMHLQAYLPLIRRSKYDAVGLPYKDGHLIMYVILPHKHGIDELKKVLQTFSASDVKSFPLSAVAQIMAIEMPKFKVKTRVSLKDPLVKQGMITTFDPEHGNFTGFSSDQVDGIFVSDIYHSVYMEVNEHETIASAASAAIFTKTRFYQFKVTRPFIFVISDRSGLMLFMGIVTRPE